jgi:phage-related protein
LSIIDDLWNFVVEQLNRIIRFVNDISIRATEGRNNIINFVNSFYDNIWREVRSIWAWIEYLKDQIASNINIAVEAAIGYARAAVTQVIGTIQSQITSIYDTFNEVYNWVSRQLTNLQEFLLRKIEEYFDAITERVNTVEQTVLKLPTISSIKDSVLDWLIAGIEKAW